MITRIVNAGEIPPVADVQLMARIGLSRVVQQQLASDTVPTSGELERIVDGVVSPLLKSGQ